MANVKKPKRHLTRIFLDYAIKGEGKNRDSGNGYWYRDKVMYFDNTPCWRVVDVPSGMKLLLVKHTGFSWYRDDPLKNMMQTLSVPDIGVFSIYENDMLQEGQQLNDRMRFMMISRVRKLVMEDVPRANALQLIKGRRKARDFEMDLQRYEQNYNDYSAFTGANWPPLPPVYRTRLEDDIKSKVDHYNSPSEVKKRERAQARKVAMEALGQAA